MSIRTERVAGEVQQALAQLFQTDFADLTDGLITVTKVRMSPDLRSGRVYVSVLGGSRSAEKTLDAIQAEVPHIRHAITKSIRLKFVPELHFYIDDTAENVSRVEEIFRKIHEEHPRSLAPEEGEGDA